MRLIRYATLRWFRDLVLAGMPPVWVLKNQRSAYIVQLVLSVPPWVRREELAPFYKESERLTRSTGTPHTVDHIVPLRHPRVCGLTVPWNLQVITQAANMQKGNKWNPDQLELFDAEEPLQKPV